MTTQVIPTRTDLSTYTQRVVLDGREYVLEFAWNQRESKWYLNLLDVDGVAIVWSIKVVVGPPLLRLLRDKRSPPGEIFAMDRSGAGEDPGLEDLGSRVLLVYIPAADLAAAG